MGGAPDLAAALARALAQGGKEALAQAAAAALAQARPCHPRGAAWALAADPGAAAALSGGDAPGLADRVAFLAGALSCLGCATCCLTSSPSLYAEDQGLIGAGLARADLVTLRPGELAGSARTGRVEPLTQELIKLREAPAGGCLRLDQGRCGVYAARPLQCRHLECWSGRHAGDLAGRPRLTREEVLAGRETELALAREYDQRLPGDQVAEALSAAARREAAALGLVDELLALDARLRAGVVGRYGLAAEELPLILGRPLTQVARAHGLSLEEPPGGPPRLARRG